MSTPSPTLVRERYETARETTPGIRARSNALVSGVEELILEVSPDAIIERRVDLVPPLDVRPELLVNGCLAVWLDEMPEDPTGFPEQTLSILCPQYRH